jgi:arylsulfatase A-like enzyme
MTQDTNSSRRRFLQWSATGGALLGLSPLLGKVAQAAEGGSRPNIVLIITDEERHYSLTEALLPSSLLGQYRSLLPGRMQLRRNGVRFNNYFTPTAPCSPARSVIFTGHHTVDNGVVDNIAA